MLVRRALALHTALCLLVGLMAFSRGAMLVCRMTGVPMAPVMASGADTHGSCCDVTATLAPDGTTRYALTSPGCCDLRQAAERVDPPAAVTPRAPEFPVAALVSAPLGAPPPVVTEVVLEVPAPRESAPRAPPLLSSASPRAPPVFS